MQKSYLALVATVILSLLLAACGASASPAASTQPPTKVARAAPADTPTTSPTSTPTAAATNVPTRAAATNTPTPASDPTPKRAAHGSKVVKKPSPTPTRRPSPTPTPRPTSTPTAQALGMPSRFVVNTPDVKIDAHIEYVGQTADGAMDVPKKWEDVAWYQKSSGGYVPGEKGNAVIAGHLDAACAGCTAVFWKLHDLRIGDIVSIVDTNGRVIRFRVVKKAVYYNDDAPLYRIFGPSNTANLNLITCDGYWNPQAKEYDRKLVVYTTMVK